MPKNFDKNVKRFIFDMQSKGIATATRRLGLIWWIMRTFNVSQQFVSFLQDNMSNEFGIELCCKYATAAYECFDMPDKAIVLGLADVIADEYKIARLAGFIFAQKLVSLIREAESQKIPILL